MANPNQLLNRLKNYDHENVPDGLFEKLKPMISDERLTVANMQKKSTAAAGLCSWVINAKRYNEILLKIRPKRE